MNSVTQQHSNATKFRRIGQGFCGSVWAAEGGGIAMKERTAVRGRSLLNDYNIHKLVLEMVSAPQKKVSVCVPRWPNFVKNDDAEGWWDVNLDKFPSGYTTCNTLCAERIPPLPQEVRNRLIDRYCPSASIMTIKTNDADRDCLVRPYLGRRKIQNAAREGKTFSLCEIILCISNQAEDLGLPILDYARAMAEILAMMHWVAKIDANDIEFVLGGIQTGMDDPKTYTHSFLGTHSLWVLDFDCCKPLTMDDAGIEQAARAFLRNDPFYPPPSRQPSDSTLWIEFQNRYLKYSHELVTEHGDIRQLPEKFIARVTEMHEQGNGRQA